MMRSVIVGLALAAGCCSGCLSRGPMAPNPVAVGCGYGCMPNPITLHPEAVGSDAYDLVFNKVYSIISDYFPEIADANRYSGIIETRPRIAPGYEQPWKRTTPDQRERLLATLQSIRHRCIVTIQPALQGGYTVGVIIYKELEDVRTGPTRQLSLPIFREATTVERQYDVIDPSVIDSNWIPKGRDTAFEQELLRRIAVCLREP